MRNRTPDSSHRNWYDELQSENTQALLDRLEAEMGKEEIEDTELIEVIMKLLDERAPVPPPQETPEESLRKFRAEYAPILEADLEEDKPRRRSVVYGFAKVAAAACLCIVMVFAVASACGVNLISEFLEWREETFVLRGKGSGQMTLDSAPEGEFASMEEAVAHYGITDPVVPTWIPKGFEVQYVRAKEQTYSINLSAAYASNNKEIKMKVYFNKTENSSDVHAEFSEPESVPYVKNDVEFLVSSNNSQYRASWVTEHCVCSINGDITEREIKQMIDSIFTEEG